MLSILMKSNKSLVVTKSKVIYQGENATETLCFIIPIEYSEEVNLGEYVCSLLTTLPDGKEYTFDLVQEPTYKDSYVTYKFEVSKEIIASQVGEVSLRLVFTKILDDVFYNLKSSVVRIDILSPEFEDDLVSLSEIQRLKNELDIRIKRLEKLHEEDEEPILPSI